MTAGPGASPDVVTGSIRLLAERGWEATTVDQLAQAAGVSRATFFRKYGSKEDIVFADHAATLRRLEELLARTDQDPATVLRTGVLLVFRHHLDHRERTLARHALLRQVPQLRDRELITSHRYERVFRAWLRTALPPGPHRETLATALSAAAVAVHNAALRSWLRAPGTDPTEELDARTARLARTLIAGLGDGTGGADGGAGRAPADLRPDGGPGGAAAPAAAGGPAVVVTVLDPGAGTEEVLAAVRAALEAAPGARGRRAQDSSARNSSASTA
ncbi:TetR/AcrR family transcriptional regulator [Kocuria flava]|uniref:TetR/AcrR family transcriptional regulator n=1 Tax=Kocuria flava TaxID=446860 RepID=UPI001FF3BC8B|nr:TetR/AcrR family transcriptional regulator [Kocuria flava]MCJ8504864.1 TetR/AcrR family transcriptional regulator [Kocuria flava]